MLQRITFAATAAAIAISTFCLPASAQVASNPVKSMLTQASDSALDQLSKPGAFSADSAIRVALPGAGGKVGKLMDLAGKAGVGGDINGALNSAAEQAAAQAKPIFHAAIDKATLGDGITALKSDTGATEYLRKTAGPEILAKLQPLVLAALQKSGVLKQTSQLSALGFNDAKLTDYVAGKTSDGIFTYVGREETKMRQNPLETGKTLLKGLKF